MRNHGDTEPRAQRHAPLSGMGGLFQCASICSCKSFCPLSGVKRYPLFGGSDFIIGGSASAKARCPLDSGVHYLKCPLKEVPLYILARSKECAQCIHEPHVSTSMSTQT